MYLITSDFKKQIQSDNLQQIIGGDLTILSAAEFAAIEEATSYLIQKYDLSQEFQDTNAWDKTLIYNTGNRVFLTANAFDAGTVYVAGNYVLQNGSIYKSIAGSAAHAFNPAEWNLICVNLQIFSAIVNVPLFDVNAPYKPGDQVYWKGKIYTCRIQSTFPTFPPDIQLVYSEAIPLPNVFPDDIQSGIPNWGIGVVYNIPANTDILNTTFWKMGDNRSQQLLTYVIDLLLYHVHSRIAPRNIPDLRIKRYDDAKSWLKMCAKGDVTAAMPLKQPTQGLRVRWGGNIKQQNSY